MAVTQISRIQVRRGRKYSPTSIPQLASGEFAWAVDSQELFIGNGSVAEGAPYVGNTKILTEHDNILSLISAYQYKEGDPNITQSVKRSLQSKLDEYVSVLDFGAVGDGIIDNSDAFERAFTNLYLDRGPGNDVYKKTLFVPAGRYVFLRSLRIPSNVILVGESKDTTSLLFLNGNGIIFSIIDPSDSQTFIEDPELFTEEVPHNIQLSNLTVAGTGGTGITASRAVLFDTINFIGTYVKADIYEWVPTSIYTVGDRVRYNGDIFECISDILIGSNISIDNIEYWTLVSAPAVYWDNISDTLKTDNIKFKDCTFAGHVTALRCNQALAPVDLITSVTADDCLFENLDSAVYLYSDAVNKKSQSNNWKFLNCNFKETNSHAIFVATGKNMLIKECNFENVGTDADGNYLVPAVSFGQSENNIVMDCMSDRQNDIGARNFGSLAYVPEVVGADRVNFLNRYHVDIQEKYSVEPIAIFSSRNDFVEINYHLKLVTGDIRTGKMSIRVNNDTSSLSFSDDYSFTSPLGRATGVIVNTTMSITKVDFGRLFVGSVISGDNIQKSTRVTEIRPNVDTATQIGDYTIDKPETAAQSNSQPINFTRDTVTNIIFDAILVNNDDSSDIETIVLQYKQLATDRSAIGVMTFDVSYGTLSV